MTGRLVWLGERVRGGEVEVGRWAPVVALAVAVAGVAPVVAPVKKAGSQSEEGGHVGRQSGALGAEVGQEQDRGGWTLWGGLGKEAGIGVHIWEEPGEGRGHVWEEPQKGLGCSRAGPWKGVGVEWGQG